MSDGCRDVWCVWFMLLAIVMQHRQDQMWLLRAPAVMLRPLGQCIRLEPVSEPCRLREGHRQPLQHYSTTDERASVSGPCQAARHDHRFLLDSARVYMRLDMAVSTRSSISACAMIPPFARRKLSDDDFSPTKRPQAVGGLGRRLFRASTWGVFAGSCAANVEICARSPRLSTASRVTPGQQRRGGDVCSVQVHRARFVWGSSCVQDGQERLLRGHKRGARFPDL